MDLVIKRWKMYLLFAFTTLILGCGAGDDECGLRVIGICFPPLPDEGTAPDTPPPGSPSGLEVEEGTVGKIKISWNKVEGVRSYAVYRNGAELPRFNFSTGKYLVDLSNELITAVDGKVNPRSNYCYSVVSLEGSKRSGHSNEACVTTSIDSLPPPAPSLNAYVDPSGPTDIVLIWKAPQQNLGNVGNFGYLDTEGYFGAEGYRVYRNGVLIADIKAPDRADIKARYRYYSDKGQTNEATYCYTVVAYDSSFNETPSWRKCATTSWHTWDLNPVFPSNISTKTRVSLNVDSWDTVHVAVSQWHQVFDISERRYKSLSRLIYTRNPKARWLDSVGGDSDPDHYAYTPDIAVSQSADVHIVHGRNYRSNRLGDPAHFEENVYEGYRQDTIKAIGLDSFGNSHLVIREDYHWGLVHASLSGGAWLFETIAEGPVLYSDMVIDDKDVLHVAYYDLDSDELRYLNNALGGWVSEVVETTSGLYENISVAVGADGKIHLGFADSTNWDLKYANNASGDWEVKILDSQGEVGGGASVAIDDNGKVHISYVDNSNDDLKYVTNESGNWMINIIDSSAYDHGVSGNTDIDVDSLGKIHIAYQDDSGARYATNQ